MSSASASKALSRAFRRFSSAVEAGQVPNVRDVELEGDSLDVWRFKLHNFDEEDTPSGKRLNEQLRKLHAEYSHPPAIIMEARFPADYPNLPFLLRVVSPRMKMYTGHVTAGGSICIEALTTSGGPGAWQPSFTVEAIVQMVVQNMLHAEETYVRTAMGGGHAGPLQVDMPRGRSATQPYTLAEATAAFERTLASHGWGNRPRLSAGSGLTAAIAGIAAPSAAAAAAAAAARGGPSSSGALAAAHGPVRATHALGRAAQSSAAAAAAAAGSMQRSTPVQQEPHRSAAVGSSAGIGGSLEGVVPGFLSSISGSQATDTRGHQAAGVATRRGRPTSIPPAPGPLLPTPAAASAPPPPTAPLIASLLHAPGMAVAPHPLPMAPQPLRLGTGAVGLPAQGAAGVRGSAQQDSSVLRKQPAAQQEVVDLTADDEDDEDDDGSKGVANVGAMAMFKSPGTMQASASSQQPRTQLPAPPHPTPIYSSTSSSVLQRDLGHGAVAGGGGDGGGVSSGVGSKKRTIEIDLTEDVPRVVRRRIQDSPSKQGLSGGQQQQQQQQQQDKAGRRQPLAPVLVDSQQQQQQQQQVPAAHGSTRKRRGAPPALATPLQEEEDVQVVGVRQPLPPPPPPSLEERLAAANRATGLDLCLPPPHWHITDEVLRGEVTFVELPLPCAKPQSAEVSAGLAELQSHGLGVMEARQALADAGNNTRRALEYLQEERALNPVDVATLISYGLSRGDAQAALLLKKGDITAAVLVCFQCVDEGIKPLDMLKEQRRRAWALKAPVAAVEPSSEQLLLQQEADVVLQRLEDNQGLQKHRVRKIQRIQNLQLFTEYESRLRKIRHQTQGNPNVQSLFHGADADTLSTIVKEGTDHRVSNLTGALGMGSYFAKSSTYSDQYSRMIKHSTYLQGSARASFGSSGWSALPGPSSAYGLQAWGMGGSNSLGLPKQKHKHKQKQKHAADGHAQPVHATYSPSFVPGCVAMLLCDVVLGKTAQGSSGLRRPPDGYHSTSDSSVPAHSTIFAVYNDDQVYPAHIIHYQ